MRIYLYQCATDQINTLAAKCLKPILLLLSLTYGLFVKIILFGYKIKLLCVQALSKPVISVGNITWGGTGKTPLVICICEYLKEKGFKPAVLTRGYMVNKAHGLKKNESISDEAVVLQETLNDVPVMVGANRFQMALSALRQGPVDVFILDDGYQHWRLRRDLNIVAINATKPFGNGYLIPRGILREPVSHLQRAQMFVITKSDLGKDNVKDIKEKLLRICPDSLIVEAQYQAGGLIDLKEKEFDKEVSFLKEKTVCSFCSIGDPESFARTLVNCGAHLKMNFAFLDHHIYSKEDIEGIIHFCKQNKIDTLVTTEKDVVKIEPYLDQLIHACDFLCLKIKIQITQGHNEFFNRISDLLHR
ncbi:MAG: tetraacyldisaccharide 4'-kinase [Candidatus Omnitrophota bacterium]